MVAHNRVEEIRPAAAVERSPAELGHDLDARTGIALQRCRAQIQWYEVHAARELVLYRTTQVSAIVLAGLTPILILVGSVPTPLQAIPPALAAVATSIGSVFHWRDNAVRFAATSELLKSELVKFETRTTSDYSEGRSGEHALNRFVQRIESLALRELAEWRAEHLADDPDRGAHAKHEP